MIDCRPFAEDLGALHDGELDGAPRLALERHLTACAACRAQLAGMKALDGAIRALPRIAPAGDFESRLRDRLALEAQPAAPTTRRAPLRTRRSRWLQVGSLVSGLAAAAAVLFWMDGVDSTRPMDGEDWQIVADEQTFDLLLDGDHDLLYALDVLEDWEDSPDPSSSESS
jgi:anti-sigma factor RsiW